MGFLRRSLAPRILYKQVIAHRFRSLVFRSLGEEQGPAQLVFRCLGILEDDPLRLAQIAGEVGPAGGCEVFS